MSLTSKRIDWWEPQVGEEERELLLQVLDSNFLNDGQYTTRFEQRLANLLGCKHVVAVTNGTSALFLALAASGIGPGSLTLTHPPHLTSPHLTSPHLFLALVRGHLTSPHLTTPPSSRAHPLTHSHSLTHSLVHSLLTHLTSLTSPLTSSTV